MRSCACPTCTLNCPRQVFHLTLTRGADALMQDSTNVTLADGDQTAQGSDVHQTHDDVVDFTKIDSVISNDSVAE
jgi:hypothetical protein